VENDRSYISATADYPLKTQAIYVELVELGVGTEEEVGQEELEKLVELGGGAGTRNWEGRGGGKGRNWRTRNWE
jgi:hypothetical protein